VNYEVEVIYLKEGEYGGRKWMRYPTKEEAEKIFNMTVKKFRRLKVSSMVIFRVTDGKIWTMTKNERT